MPHRRLKNFISVIAAVIITSAVLFAYAYAESGISSISVTVKDAALSPSDMITVAVPNDDYSQYAEKSVYDVYDYDNITLKVIYSDGSSASYTSDGLARFLAGRGLSLDVSDDQLSSPWQAGTHKVTYSIGSLSSSVNYTVAENEIKSVSVKPMYDIEVTQGQGGRTEACSDPLTGEISQYYSYDLEKFDYYITITYKDGTSLTCPKSDLYDMTGYKAVFSHERTELKAGRHTALCTVNGVSGTFSFTVKENNVASVSLYMTDNAQNLSFPDDGMYTAADDGNEYFRFLYNRTKIRAKVTYTDGTVKDYALGALTAALKSELVIYDNQSTTPFAYGKNVLNCEIGGTPCTLTLNIPAGYVGKAKAEKLSSSSAKVSWSRVPCDGYEIQLLTENGWSTVYDADHTEASAVIKNLPGGNVTLAINAYYTSNSVRTYTGRKSVSVALSPEKPSGFSAVTYAYSVKLSWDKHADADSYSLTQYKDGKWTQIASPDSSVTSYAVKGLSPNTSYSFGIAAVKNGMAGEYTLLDLITTPTEVTGFTATPYGLSVKLSWNKNSTASGYRLEQLTDGGWSTVRILSSDTLSYSVTNLSPNTAYSFRISSYKIHAGKKIYSYAKQIAARTTPTEPSALKAKPYGLSVRLSWNKNSTADGYRIQRYSNGSWIDVVSLPSGTTSYLVKGLSPNTDYKFRVSTYKKYSDRTIYSYAKQIAARTTPTEPSALKAKPYGLSVRLSWNKNSTADGYRIQRYSNGSWIDVVSLPSGTTSYLVKGLSPNADYKFRVSTYKKHADRTIYSYAKQTAARTTPTEPSALKASPLSKAVSLSWNRNTTASGYYIQQYKNGSWVTVVKLGAASTGYKISGLKPGTTYKFRICSYKSYPSKVIKSAYKTLTVTTR